MSITKQKLKNIDFQYKFNINLWINPPRYRNDWVVKVCNGLNMTWTRSASRKP